MQITSIKRQTRRRDRLNVYLDGEPYMALAAEVVLRAGLRRGQELDASALAALEAEDAAWRAREAALSLLSHRQRTEGEIRQRLRARGFPPEPIQSTVAKLKEAGLIDDQVFARTFVAERLRTRPSGRQRLVFELRSKGIDEDEAASIVDEVLAASSESDFERANRALAKFSRRPAEDPLRVKRRMYGYLARRGFDGETIRRIVREYE